jgi:hypothetical protein
MFIVHAVQNSAAFGERRKTPIAMATNARAWTTKNRTPTRVNRNGPASTTDSAPSAKNQKWTNPIQGYSSQAVHDPVRRCCGWAKIRLQLHKSVTSDS